MNIFVSISEQQQNIEKKVQSLFFQGKVDYDNWIQDPALLGQLFQHLKV